MILSMPVHCDISISKYHLRKIVNKSILVESSLGLMAINTNITINQHQHQYNSLSHQVLMMTNITRAYSGDYMCR